MPTISLCMIVKNEEANLACCLDSVADLVDEIIIVDTGSTDRTVEIASRYTEKVYSYSWRDDFSDARNESFSRAAMDYCMWMDADDVLEGTQRDGFLQLKRTLSPDADMIRLRFIRKTHCQKDFMLWRVSARLGGVSGIDFNVLGNPAELVRKLKMNADIAVFVNLDMVYQFNQDFAGQLFDVLIFRKGYQRGMLLVNAV